MLLHVSCVEMGRGMAYLELNDTKQGMALFVPTKRLILRSRRRWKWEIRFPNATWLQLMRVGGSERRAQSTQRPTLQDGPLFSLPSLAPLHRWYG